MNTIVSAASNLNSLQLFRAQINQALSNVPKLNQEIEHANTVETLSTILTENITEAFKIVTCINDFFKNLPPISSINGPIKEQENNSEEEIKAKVSEAMF